MIVETQMFLNAPKAVVWATISDIKNAADIFREVERIVTV